MYETINCTVITYSMYCTFTSEVTMTDKCPEHDACFKELQQGLNRIATEMVDIKLQNVKLHEALLGTLDKEGIVSKVIKAEKHIKECEKLWGEIHENKNFRQSATKALWVIYSAVVGLFVKVVFLK